MRVAVRFGERAVGVDLERHVEEVGHGIAVVGFADVGEPVRRDAQSRFLAHLARERVRAEQLVAFLAAAGQVPQRFRVVGVTARDHQQRPVTHEDPRAQVDAPPWGASH